MERADFPGHCGWYPIVVCEIDKNGRFHKETGVEKVAPCGEQVNNREADTPITAWPIAGRTLEAAAGAEGLEAEQAIYDLAKERCGLWRSCAYEMEEGYESEGSAYSTAKETDDRSERSGRSGWTDRRSDRVSAKSSRSSRR